MATIDIPPNRSIFLVNVSSAAKTFRLPAVSSFPGRMIIFKDIFGAAGNSSIFLSTTGTDIIERSTATTTRLSTTYGAWTYLNDGVRTWFLADMYANTMFISTLAGAATFSPTSISGLQLWMDAADSSAASMTLSGSTVTTWRDKSGNNNHTTARSGTPTLTSAAINGRSAISMAGGYFTGTFATANTGNQAHSFGVMSIDSSTGVWPRPFSLGRPGVDDYSSSTTTFMIIRYAGTQAVAIGRNGQYLSVNIPAYSSPFLVQSSHNGALEYMSVNGTLTPSVLNTGQSGNFNITSYGLGVNTNTGDYFVWNGFYAEIIYYNVQLSDANRQRVEGYLAWKWGLQGNLPNDHPHKSAAP
jgi:hypothetical protein